MEEDSLPPPEVIFHRYFQDQEHLSRSDRENYYGKQDLDRLEPELRFILTNIQLVFNESLSQAQGATAYVGSPVVPHFDYISAEVANALAFKYQRYSFIGITMPLVDLLLRSSECLSQSGGVRELFNAVAGVAEERQDSALWGLFMIQLGFVAGHEFGHHAFGHTSQDEGEFWNEVVGTTSGSLEAQVRESVADIYAVYAMLDHVIVSEQRQEILSSLGRPNVRDQQADQVLLLAFLIAVGAFFFVRRPAAVDKVSIYTLTHPPQAVRMNNVMQVVRTWCQRFRPGLNALLTLQMYNALMEAIVSATKDMTLGTNWEEQTAFFLSADGEEYCRRFAEQGSRMATHAVETGHS